VVLFHAGVPWLAGGFVAVDVFFVLSGFFITGLLARELSGTGTVDLPAFYGRRALRLLPSLLVVLAATLAAVTWLYAPIDRPAAALGARAAALSGANVALAGRAVNYFSSDDDPLLHTWSLGVEQQFYLLWPVLLLFVALVAESLAARAERRAAVAGAADAGMPAARPDVGRGALLAGIAAAGALSFAASVWLTRHSPSWAFFGTPGRIWEFAAGGALAVAVAGRPRPEGREAAGSLLQLAGLAAVAAAAVAYDRGRPYPGVAALLPVAGTVAILAGGWLAPAGPTARALGAAPLRWLGRLSYTWYLWHWPLVSVAAVLVPGLGVGGRLAWSLAALGLAWLTHRLVERPTAAGTLGRLPAPQVAALALGATLAAGLAAHGAARAADRRAADPVQQALARARDDRMPHDCWVAGAKPTSGPCVFGDTMSPVTLALLGDSHAEHWLGGLDRAGRAGRWRVLAMVKGGCPVADAPELARGRWAARGRECARYREAMLRRIIAARPAAVILSSWDHYVAADGAPRGAGVTPAEWGRGLRRTYARLSAAGVPVVVIRGTPHPGFDVPACLSRRAAGLPFARSCTYARDRAFILAAVAAQTRAAAGLRVRFVDMNDQICAGPRCPPARGGVVVFTDDNHLTASFSRTVAPVLVARVEGALAGLGVSLR
jgi:peptidoglycan/LPS O-acetylase OafA/YrhL